MKSWDFLFLSWIERLRFPVVVHSPLQDDGNFNPDDDDNDDDDGDPYYIMIPKADELMPKECIFDRLERAEADKWVASYMVVVDILLQDSENQDIINYCYVHLTFTM